ncbi:unnamed protein product [Bubo scandiacus]
MSGFSFEPLTPKRPLNDSSVSREGQRSWCRVWSTGQEGMASSCTRAGSDWLLGRISLQKGLLGVGMGCPGQGGSPHPWRG